MDSIYFFSNGLDIEIMSSLFSKMFEFMSILSGIFKKVLRIFSLVISNLTK